MKREPLLLTCDRCHTEWLYKGKHNYYACCPDCRRYVPIREMTRQESPEN